MLLQFNILKVHMTNFIAIVVVNRLPCLVHASNSKTEVITC